MPANPEASLQSTSFSLFVRGTSVEGTVNVGMRFFQSVLYLKRRVAVKKSLLEHHKLSRNTHVSQGCSVGSKKALGFCFALMYKTTARPLSGQSLLSQPTYRQFPRFMRRVQQRCSALCLRAPAWASIIVSLVLPKDWSSIECVC